MTIGIYEIRCTANRKRYVGSSINIERRWKVHANRLNRNMHVNPILQAAWNKYGIESFLFRIAHVCEKHELLHMEQQFLDTQQFEFNIAIAADNPMRGRKASEAWHKKTAETYAKKRAKRLAASGQICSKCGMFKKWDEFHKNKATVTGRVGYCRPCLKAYGERYLISAEEKVKNEVIRRQKISATSKGRKRGKKHD